MEEAIRMSTQSNPKRLKSVIVRAVEDFVQHYIHADRSKGIPDWFKVEDELIPLLRNINRLQLVCCFARPYSKPKERKVEPVHYQLDPRKKVVTTVDEPVGSPVDCGNWTKDLNDPLNQLHQANIILPDIYTWAYGSVKFKIDSFLASIIVPGTVVDSQYAVDYNSMEPDIITWAVDKYSWLSGLIPPWLQLYEQVRAALWGLTYPLATVDLIVTTSNIATNECGEQEMIENDHYFKFARTQSPQIHITLDDLLKPAEPELIAPTLPEGNPIDNPSNEDSPNIVLLPDGSPLPDGTVDDNDMPIPGYWTQEGGWFIYIPAIVEGVGSLDAHFLDGSCWPYWLGPSYTAKRKELDSYPSKYRFITTDESQNTTWLQTDQCQSCMDGTYCGFEYRRVYLSWQEYHSPDQQ
jgi:hypothetical protein